MHRASVGPKRHPDQVPPSGNDFDYQSSSGHHSINLCNDQRFCIVSTCLSDTPSSGCSRCLTQWWSSSSHISQYLPSFTAPAYPVYKPSPAVMQPGGQLRIPAAPLPGLQFTAPLSGSVPYCQMSNRPVAVSQPVNQPALTTQSMLQPQSHQLGPHLCNLLRLSLRPRRSLSTSQCK